MHEYRTTQRVTLPNGQQVRGLVGYRHSRLLPCAVVYVHGELDPKLVPTDELMIR